MTGLAKAGYFLLGMSAGVFAATALYEREIRRSVGEEERFEPTRDDITDSVHDEEPTWSPDAYSAKERVDKGIQDLEEKALNRRKYVKVEESRKTNYTNKYQNGKDRVDSILDSLGPVSEDEAAEMKEALDEVSELEDMESYIPDSPPEDEAAEADESLVTERVEEWIEVYLDENPQDFVSLVYYQGDETLCDDREQLISNPEEVVGDVALGRLVEGGPGAENGVIFVRNLKTMLNYEVVLDAGKYSETVLGIFESRLAKGGGGDVDTK